MFCCSLSFSLYILRRDFLSQVVTAIVVVVIVYRIQKLKKQPKILRLLHLKLHLCLLAKEEFEALGRVMSPGGQYNPNLLPDMQGKLFWSSSASPRSSDRAFLFSGDVGGVGSLNRKDSFSVRSCVPWRGDFT